MEPHKTSDIWLPLLFALVLIIGMFLGFKLSNHSRKSSFSSHSSLQLDNLIQLIADKYVDSIDIKKLRRGGIEGIIKNLDPHTVYIPAGELVRVNEELEGNFSGIGVEFYMHEDSVTVSYVIPDGPSSKQNLIPGDKIIKINDRTVAGKDLELEEIINEIRGQNNSEILLTLLDLNGRQKKVKLRRGSIPLKSVTAFFRVDHETGYIKIDLFSETTYDEFMNALSILKKEGISKLLIDVRDNPGGYMDAVAKVADELVSGTHTIVSTKNKYHQDSLTTKVDGLFETGKLCILVDENSASASEILAGAIQDLDRGIIVGRRTYGKGLVQEQFELPDHAAIRITTARYYLPSGRSIQRSYSNGKEKYKHDIIDRFTNGELLHEDSVHESSKPFLTLKKKLVYSEEGINPNVFVPLDTNYHSELNEFYNNHLAEEFAQKYVFKYHPDFDHYKNIHTFHEEFIINDNIKTALKLFLTKHKISGTVMDNQDIYKEIERAIKAQMARLLFGNNGKYKELYVDDPFIKKAIEAMRK